jgi:outer membrane biosynthesis protein TonB
MKRLGVVLAVLGVVCIVVGLFPKLAGTPEPEPGFGPQQTVAVIAGAVVLLVGIIMCAKGGKPAGAEPQAPPAGPPPAPGEATGPEPPKPEEPKEAPAPEEKKEEGPPKPEQPGN